MNMNPLNPERFMIDESIIEKDYDYMRRLMPASFYNLFELIEDICDRLEYKDSFLFDEYPDKTIIQNLTDKIYSQLEDTDRKTLISDSSNPLLLKNFIQSFLLNEILLRRCRYYHKMKRFHIHSWYKA